MDRLRRFSALLTAAAVASHLLFGCCGAAHVAAGEHDADHAVAHEGHAHDGHGHDLHAHDHDCEHHDSQSEGSHDEPCGTHCGTCCAPATMDRTDVAAPAPLDFSTALFVAPVAATELDVNFRPDGAASVVMPPQPLPVLHCALRN